MTVPSAFSIAQKISAEHACDVVVYNGTIARDHVLSFVEEIHESKKYDNLLLIIATDGGDPDAAYKMSRYLQRRYKKVTVLISGLCKSAGTLMAVGAHEVAFAPYGELGPLDIQTYMTDNLSGMESGLTITEAIDTLVRKSVDLHREHYTRIMQSTGRVVSFASAAKVATEFSTGLFAPIFARIDPYDVAQKARSMRIANDYGERLSQHGKNLKQGTLDKLTRGYPSHSFVIDHEEANELFDNCRTLTDDEIALISALGSLAREELRLPRPLILFLSTVDEGGDDDQGTEDGNDPPNGDTGGDNGSSGGEVADAGGQADPEAKPDGGSLAGGVEQAEPPAAG